jgi:hypothetical protein
MAFSLSERVLFGLLAVDDRDLRALLTAFDQIEANPIGWCHAATLDRRGRLIYAASVDGFWLYYSLGKTGKVHFTELQRID